MLNNVKYMKSSQKIMSAIFYIYYTKVEILDPIVYMYPEQQ